MDIRELMNEVWTMAQERPEAQERRLVSDISQISGKMIGDHDLLLLALLNLLDNALKFTQPTDTIILKACIEEETVMIEIIDTGFGIPPEEVALVWEELYRGAGANGIEGNGIGLALVQAIVQRHSGQTTLSSRVGHGTRVMLRLPLHSK
jgi:two-component system OmpR family sensor kinase